MSFNRWMDKEDMAHVYNGILHLHQKGWIPNFCINMDRTGGDYAKWNKSSRESQLSYGFTDLWRITNNRVDMGRWRGEGSWGKLEGEVNHERLWTPKNNLRVLKGPGWEVEGARWWVLGRIAWSTGCGAKTMNTITLKRNNKKKMLDAQGGRGLWWGKTPSSEMNLWMAEMFSISRSSNWATLLVSSWIYIEN